MTTNDKPPTRQIFRQLAAIVAVFMVGCAIAFIILEPNSSIFVIGVFLFNAFLMAKIAMTGAWLPQPFASPAMPKEPGAP